MSVPCYKSPSLPPGCLLLIFFIVTEKSFWRQALFHSSVLLNGPTFLFMSFPGGSDGKESACNMGDLDLIPGSGRSPGKGHGNPLQYSHLENRRGQRSLVGCSPWCLKESDMTQQLSTHTSFQKSSQLFSLSHKARLSQTDCFWIGGKLLYNAVLFLPYNMNQP